VKLRASTVIASVFGIGYFPFASGTVMSAVAIPPAILIGLQGGGLALLVASILAFAIGVLACDRHVRATGREDPCECVIDELAGQWLACAFALFSFNGLIPEAQLSLPAFALTFGLAFVLFRLFDIWKPWPVSWADTWPGSTSSPG
jgi:phosphatidylglycerophosphatase A